MRRQVRAFRELRAALICGKLAVRCRCFVDLFGDELFSREVRISWHPACEIHSPDGLLN
jgi:hypothetical protein